MHAFEKLSSLVNGGEQLCRLSDIQRDRYRNQDPQQFPFDRIAVDLELISRMPPLSKPKLENSSCTSQRVIETRITLRPNHRHHASCDDVNERDDADNVDGQK